MQLEFVDTLGDRDLRPRQEAGTDAIGNRAEAEIEAGGLDLAFDEVVFGQDQPGLSHCLDHAVGQDSIGIGGEGERHSQVLRSAFRDNTLKNRNFTGYLKRALTERASGNRNTVIPW